MPDGRNDGCPAGCGRPNHGLVGEPEQVLEAAAAPGHDNDIDIGVLIEFVYGLDHLGRALRSLHVGVNHCELNRGPAQTGIGDDITLGPCLGSANQSDPRRKLG